MQTYLNEFYHQTDQNKSANIKNITSIKKGKNLSNTNNTKSKTNNNISQSKSSLFLNNFFRSNKKPINNIEMHSKKNFKKRKKKTINITPYQRMGNEYILNYALDNLNKYQEDLLIKENNEDEKNNVNNELNELNEQISYYNNFIDNEKMNKSSKNFRTSYKHINKKEENIFNKFYNNKKYSEYFLRNDLFDDYKDIKNGGKGNEEIPEPEPYIINKYASKNNNINNCNNKLNKNNNIDIKLNFTLSNLELNELKQIFEDNYIFFDDLFLLTKEDFVEMKIPIGPRNRLLNFIKKYKSYAQNFDLNELSSFMNKYKESINSNEMDNTLGETPSTNNKYKSTMTTDTNKNKGSNDSKGKGLNISNLEENDSLLKHKNKNKGRRDDLNEIIHQNNIDENNNKIFNTYKTIESKNNNEEENENDLDNNVNNNNINQNIFSNSLFNEFTSNMTDLKDSNIDNIINITYNKNNSLKNECLNNLVSKDTTHFITNNNIVPTIINKNNNQIQNNNNKKIKTQNTYYKNYQNIFSEIEKYQINYEKMKKENNDRNSKINNLLDKKSKTNIQYLKLKLQNSKYYNDDDLKNESVRDLDKELQKMNFLQQDNNSHNFSKKRKEIRNPLIEEFNKRK